MRRALLKIIAVVAGLVSAVLVGVAWYIVSEDDDPVQLLKDVWYGPIVSVCAGTYVFRRIWRWRPVIVCDKCASISSDRSKIGQSRHSGGGATVCPGTFREIFPKTNWKRCPECSGRGGAGLPWSFTACVSCEGTGWEAARGLETNELASSAPPLNADRPPSPRPSSALVEQRQSSTSSLTASYDEPDDGRPLSRFQGLGEQELARLSTKSRTFAESVHVARRGAPLNRRFAIVGYRLLKADIDYKDLPGPWYVAAPVAFLINRMCRGVGRVLYNRSVEKLQMAKARVLVVWLRRFHVHGLNKFPLHELFEQISAWGVVACTLSDDVVFRSTLIVQEIRAQALQEAEMETAWVRWLKGFVQFVVLALLLAGAIGVLLATREQRWFIVLGALIAYLPLFLFFAVFCFYLVDRFIYSRKQFMSRFRALASQNLSEMSTVTAVGADHFFRDLFDDSGHLDRERGYLPLVVSDVDWQAVVKTAISYSSAVLLDVTNISSNLKWEIAHLRESVAFERIVLLFGFSGTFNGTTGWENHASSPRLDELLGVEWRQKCQKFCYPELILANDDKISQLFKELMSKVYEAAMPPVKAQQVSSFAATSPSMYSQVST
jgi:hypothetical protein